MGTIIDEARRLAKSHPEIGGHYSKGGMTLKSLAEWFANGYTPQRAHLIMKSTIKILIPSKTKRRRIANEHRRATGKLSYINGVVSPIPCLEAINRSMWSLEAKKHAMWLMTGNPRFLHQKGNHKGQPDYWAIALEIHRVFPKEPMRSAAAIRALKRTALRIKTSRGTRHLLRARVTPDK